MLVPRPAPGWVVVTTWTGGTTTVGLSVSVPLPPTGGGGGGGRAECEGTGPAPPPGADELLLVGRGRTTVVVRERVVKPCTVVTDSVALAPADAMGQTVVPTAMTEVVTWAGQLVTEAAHEVMVYVLVE